MSLYFTPDKRKITSTFIDKVAECRAKECAICPRNEAKLETPKMQPAGFSNPLLYVLGETPSRHEDQQGEHLLGKYGRLIRDNLQEIEDYCRFSNTARCYSQDLTWDAIECCRPSVIADIEKSKPTAILAIGKTPLKWLLGEDNISAWRGRRAPVKIGTHTCWVYPIMHPSYILRQGYRGADLVTFKKDMARVVDAVLDELPLPKVELDPTADVDVLNAEKAIEVFRERFQNDMSEKLATELREGVFGEICEALKEAEKADLVGVDIETTALRPYGEGVIRTIGLSTPDRTFAFPYYPELFKPVRHFLLSEKPIKIAHNLNFELEWFVKFFGDDVARSSRWEDTNAQAYCLDERTGALSLNSLCVQYFGLPLKSVSDIDLSNVAKAEMEPLLLYNGMDAKYTLKLFQEQAIRIENEDLQNVYEEQLRRIPTVVFTQNRGLLIDQEVAKQHFVTLTERLVDSIAKMRALDCIKAFERVDAGVTDLSKPSAQFNPASPAQVLFVFKDILGYDKELKKDNRYSTDKTILPKIDHPLAQLILEFRNIQKLRGTYVEGFLDEAPEVSPQFPPKRVGRELWPDGKAHSNFPTTFVATGRLSSRNPNLQNLPSRHDKHIRTMWIPEKDHVFISCDYGQIEARVIGAMSQDKVLCDALRTKYDIHMDWAERLIQAYPKRIGGEKFIGDKDKMKAFRTDVKNQFVFPAFYGATEESIAEYLNIPLRYCEPIFADFWRTFSGVKEWQQDLIKFYNKHGYVECLTGRRRREPLGKNEIINSPVQGTASDIVVDAMNRLSEQAQFDNQWYYQAKLNIHDDLTFSVPKKNQEDHLAEIVFNMLDCPYKFMTVPLSVEAAVGPNLFEMKDAGTYFSDDF